jgi:hypothetical protein
MIVIKILCFNETFLNLFAEKWLFAFIVSAAKMGAWEASSHCHHLEAFSVNFINISDDSPRQDVCDLFVLFLLSRV